jgi:hypothetical protein
MPSHRTTALFARSSPLFALATLAGDASPQHCTHHPYLAAKACSNAGQSSWQSTGVRGAADLAEEQAGGTAVPLRSTHQTTPDILGQRSRESVDRDLQWASRS